MGTRSPEYSCEIILLQPGTSVVIIGNDIEAASSSDFDKSLPGRKNNYIHFFVNIEHIFTFS